MDKSTNNRILQRIAAAVIAATASFGLVWICRNRRLFTVNDVTTGESFDYPELRAHVYYSDPETTLSAAKRAVESQSDFRLVQIDSEQQVLMAEALSSSGNFVDDVVIQVEPMGPRHTRVIVRSRSRTGRGDLGENAKHIRSLQASMDDILVGG